MSAVAEIVEMVHNDIKDQVNVTPELQARGNGELKYVARLNEHFNWDDLISMVVPCLAGNIDEVLFTVTATMTKDNKTFDIIIVNQVTADDIVSNIFHAETKEPLGTLEKRMGSMSDFLDHVHHMLNKDADDRMNSLLQSIANATQGNVQLLW